VPGVHKIHPRLTDGDKNFIPKPPVAQGQHYSRMSHGENKSLLPEKMHGNDLYELLVIAGRNLLSVTSENR
jgi:hypothetical protein